MRKTFKYRLYPNKQQQRLLGQQLEECRWLYNQLLAERRNAWEQRQESLRLSDQQAILPALKADRPTLVGVQSQVLRNVAMRLDLAFQAFFRRVKAGEKEPGYPRFRGAGRYDSLTYPQVPVGCTLDADARRVRIMRVGLVKIVPHRPLEGTPKTATIRAPRKVVARVYERTRWRREDFTHQHSRRIVNTFDVMAVEDLSVNRMVRNHCLARSIHDAAWSQFADLIAYKAAWAGRRCVAVNPAYTSQDCWRCGHRQSLSLSDRLYTCPCCGLVLDRDLNASRNIVRLGQQSLAPA